MSTLLSPSFVSLPNQANQEIPHATTENESKREPCQAESMVGNLKNLLSILSERTNMSEQDNSRKS